MEDRGLLAREGGAGRRLALRGGHLRRVVGHGGRAALCARHRECGGRPGEGRAGRLLPLRPDGRGDGLPGRRRRQRHEGAEAPPRLGRPVLLGLGGRGDLCASQVHERRRGLVPDGPLAAGEGYRASRGARARLRGGLHERRLPHGLRDERRRCAQRRDERRPRRRDPRPVRGGGRLLLPGLDPPRPRAVGGGLSGEESLQREPLRLPDGLPSARRALLADLSRQPGRAGGLVVAPVEADGRGSPERRQRGAAGLAGLLPVHPARLHGPHARADRRPRGGLRGEASDRDRLGARLGRLRAERPPDGPRAGDGPGTRLEPDGPLSGPVRRVRLARRPRQPGGRDVELHVRGPHRL